MGLLEDHGCRRAAMICACGLAMRIGLALSGLQPTLAGAMELIVSSTSWERAQEGYFLGTMGLSHYASGVFSGSPLMLAAVAFYTMLPASVQFLAVASLFGAVDLASALFLRAICMRAVAVESGDWETDLEEWMDEDSKPPTAVSNQITSKGTSSRESVLAPEPSKEEYVDRHGGIASSRYSTGNPLAGRDGAKWKLPDIVLAAYFLNPVIAGQCAALSGDVLGRVLPLAALAAAGSRRPGITAAALAAATCLWRFYSLPLILPIALILGNNCSGNGGGMHVEDQNRKDNTSFPTAQRYGPRGEDGDGSARRKIANEGRLQRPQDNRAASARASGGKGGTEMPGIVDDATAAEAVFDPRNFQLDGAALLRLFSAFALWCLFILGACWAATSGWGFLRAAADSQLLCEDLTPNIGLYWYFFAEVFPRFRGFFRVLFLSQPYVYVLPATLRLGMFPEALASLLLAIFGLFQPYPTMADPILAGCLFLCHPRTSARMRLVIPVGMAALVPSFLLPIMRHLWLQAGTGNANFYYFQTVALNVLLAVFVLQFAAALVKRRKALTVAFHKRRKAMANAVENADSKDGTAIVGVTKGS